MACPLSRSDLIVHRYRWLSFRACKLCITDFLPFAHLISQTYAVLSKNSSRSRIRESRTAIAKASREKNSKIITRSFSRKRGFAGAGASAVLIWRRIAQDRRLLIYARSGSGKKRDPSSCVPACVQCASAEHNTARIERRRLRHDDVSLVSWKEVSAGQCCARHERIEFDRRRMEQLGKKATWTRRLGLICCLALLLGLIVFENSCGLLQYQPRRSRTAHSAGRAPAEESRVEEISLLVEGEGPDSSSMSKVQLVPLWPNNDTYKEAIEGLVKYKVLRQQGLIASRQLPSALIIGVKKGGTRALLEFMRLHPDIRAAGSEVHFFDHHYSKGFHWYRHRMPATLEGQITMEKTPSYFVTAEAPRRVQLMDPGTKLIVVVRDPVTRAISDYTQVKSKRSGMPRFEELAFLNGSSVVDTSWAPLRIGVYAKHLERWLNYFPLSQLLFVSGERLIADPALEITRVQDFLGLKRLISEKHFYFNATKGFPCLLKSEERATPHCLGKNKGRSHPFIDPTAIQRLRDFYRPFNRRFYQLTGIDFGWP